MLLKKLKWGLVAASILAVAIAAILGRGKFGGSGGPTPERLALGQRLYDESCAACHGTDLKGGWPGFWLLLGLILAANLVATWSGVPADSGKSLAAAAVAPLLALLSLALALGALSLALVFLATLPFPRRMP